MHPFPSSCAIWRCYPRLSSYPTQLGQTNHHLTYHKRRQKSLHLNTPISSRLSFSFTVVPFPKRQFHHAAPLFSVPTNNHNDPPLETSTTPSPAEGRARTTEIFSYSLPMTYLTAVSPLDGRYFKVTAPLRSIFSEYGLIKARVKVEIRWLQFLSSQKEIKELPELSPDAANFLESIISKFSLNDAKKVKDIEWTTKHDLKAVEYFLKGKFADHPELSSRAEFLHFACTSEDVNNLAYALLVREARRNILRPLMGELIDRLNKMAHTLATVPMLSRTHGQAATPTTMGKELANFAYRLNIQRNIVSAVLIKGKMNGAVGNYNAHVIAYPEINWMDVSNQFLQSLNLFPNPYTTQIEPHDYLSEIFDAITRFNTILLDLNRDMWGYISLGYFKQRTIEGEVGSSTMPHKINPIDFENSEGNIGVSNAILSHLSQKLPVSRFQRDLSDSTALRSIGTGIGHAIVAYSSCIKGLERLEINRPRVEEDLDSNWEVLGEAYQTVMRRYGIEKPYERLKAITRGKRVGKETMLELVRTLDIPAEAKKALEELTPSSYIGLAAKLAQDVSKKSRARVSKDQPEEI